MIVTVFDEAGLDDVAAYMRLGYHIREYQEVSLLWVDLPEHRKERWRSLARDAILAIHAAEKAVDYPGSVRDADTG